KCIRPCSCIQMTIGTIHFITQIFSNLSFWTYIISGVQNQLPAITHQLTTFFVRNSVVSGTFQISSSSARVSFVLTVPEDSVLLFSLLLHSKKANNTMGKYIINTIFFIFLLNRSIAQFVPKDSAKLNYNQIMFEAPYNKDAKSYTFYVTYDSINNPSKK